MNGTKRNLCWIGAGVLTVGVLAGTGYYLFSSLRAERRIEDQLEAKVARCRELAEAKPHPGGGDVDNIAAARRDEQRVTALCGKMRKLLAAVPTAEALDTREFKLLLENAEAELERKAEAAGVVVPKPYSFTFEAVRRSATLEAAALSPLSQQLAEVRTLCDILFDAGVRSIEGMRRVSVSRHDTGSSDYLPKPAVTNALAVLMPYEIIFKGFSAELAAVIDGLSHSPHGFIIRSLNTEVTTPPVATAEATSASAGTTGEPSEAQLEAERIAVYKRRYGPGYAAAQAMPTPQVPLATTPSSRRGPVTVISEKPLRVTMLIDAVRLRGEETQASARRSGR